MRIHGLTDRRWEVAALVTEGLTDKQIAEALGIKKRTVNTHVHAIALAWNLDASKDLRVEIVKRVTAQQASPSGNSGNDRAA